MQLLKKRRKNFCRRKKKSSGAFEQGKASSMPGRCRRAGPWVALHWRHALVSCMSACPIDLSGWSSPCVSAWITMTFPRRRPARSMHRWSRGGPNKIQQLALMTARSISQTATRTGRAYLGAPPLADRARAHRHDDDTNNKRAASPGYQKLTNTSNISARPRSLQPPSPSSFPFPSLCSPILF